MLVEVVAALQHADGSVKRQWVVNAAEISCISSYPSTVGTRHQIPLMWNDYIKIYTWYHCCKHVHGQVLHLCRSGTKKSMLLVT